MFDFIGYVGLVWVFVGFTFALAVVIVLLVTALGCLIIVLIVQYYLKWGV